MLMTENSSILPVNYPVDWISKFTLEGGTIVTVRPIQPDDAARLQEGFTHLSAESIYYRFLDTTKVLTDSLARRLATLDYHSQMAFVGVVSEAGEVRLIGVARYALVGDRDPEAAETAVIVRDDFHGRGLGTYLYEQLISYARQQGIKYFVATVHQSNAIVMNFIRRSGLPYDRKVLEPGVLSIRIHLTIDDQSS